MVCKEAFVIHVLYLYYNYVAEKVDKDIPNTDFLRHREDDYYLDIRSIFIFERLFF